MSRRTITSPLLDFLFPPLCLACETEERPGPLTLGLCLPCRGRLKPLGGPRCAGCGEPLGAAALPAGYLCGACRQRPPAYSRLHAVWSYEPPLEQVVHAFKFGRLDFLGRHIAEEIWHRLGGRLREIEAVVPVPLHWRRRLARGYNQAERIARPLARRLSRPLIHGLRRPRATATQARLERSLRRANLRGAFRATRAPDIRGRRLLLVDDVATTTETLREAAAALRRAGAASVVALAAAHTPAPAAPHPSPLARGPVPVGRSGSAAARGTRAGRRGRAV